MYDKISQRRLTLTFNVMLCDAKENQLHDSVNSNNEYTCIIYILFSQTKTSLLRGYSQNNY